jgi:hypothetical protein
MQKSAERIFYYEGEDQTRDLVVRGGWTLEDLIITATNPSGLKKSEKNQWISPKFSVDKYLKTSKKPVLTH